jgi:hypothetical protein
MDGVMALNARLARAAEVSTAAANCCVLPIMRRTGAVNLSMASNMAGTFTAAAIVIYLCSILYELSQYQGTSILNKNGLHRRDEDRLYIRVSSETHEPH